MYKDLMEKSFRQREGYSQNQADLQNREDYMYDYNLVNKRMRGLKGKEQARA